MTEFVSTKEAARRLGVTVQHVRLLARKGQVSAKQDPHGRWSFAVDGLPEQPRRPRRHRAAPGVHTGAEGSAGSQGELVNVDAVVTPTERPAHVDAPRVVELEREIQRLREENEVLKKKLDQAKTLSELLGTASRLVDMLE